jgi:hypothetical protein
MKSVGPSGQGALSCEIELPKPFDILAKNALT